MTPSPEGWPTKAKQALSPHEVRLALLDTNTVFQIEVIQIMHCEFEITVQNELPFQLAL